MQENEKEQAAGDDDNEMVTSKTLAALGILNTLGTLILSVETKPELLRALEDAIQPILLFVLENVVYGAYTPNVVLISDLMSEVFEIIDSCTFSTRSISPTMWSFFPVIHKTFKEYAIDYIDGNLEKTLLLTLKKSSLLLITTSPSAPRSSQRTKNTKKCSSTTSSPLSKPHV